MNSLYSNIINDFNTSLELIEESFVEIIKRHEVFRIQFILNIKKEEKDGRRNAMFIKMNI